MRDRTFKRRPHRAFMLLDTVGGLVLLLTTILLLASVTARGRSAARRLASDRAATRLAESALLRGSSAATQPVEGVEMTTLDALAPPTFVWATATAHVDGRSVAIVGLVRDRPAAKGGTP